MKNAILETSSCSRDDRYSTDETAPQRNPRIRMLSTDMESSSNLKSLSNGTASASTAVPNASESPMMRSGGFLSSIRFADTQARPYDAADMSINTLPTKSSSPHEAPPLATSN